MSEQTAATPRPAGSIYDLGYRPYDGERLGRGYAVRSLFAYSLRAIFGLGRSTMSKVFPFGLAVVALLPALVQLAIAAIAPSDFEFIAPEGYFSFVQIVVALFCAVVAPEIIGRDQRHRTLPLYFSRVLSRVDYVSAKIGALTVGLMLVLGVPQLLLLVGNAVSTDDLTGYAQDNIDQLPPILASVSLAAFFMGTVSLVIACQTSRRAFATGAVLAYFVIMTIIGSILVETTTGDVRQYVILVSPITVLEGAVYWIFGADWPVDSDMAKSGLAGGYYVLAALAYPLVAAGLLYRRFQKLAV